MKGALRVAGKAGPMPAQVTLIIACKPGTTVALREADVALAEVLVVSGHNVSQQRNLGAAQAATELLWFLDDDAHFCADSLRTGVQLMQSDPTWAAVGGPSLTRSGAGFWERLFGSVMGSWFATLTTCPRHRAVGLPRPASGQELITCNLLVRRQWFEKIGGFDLSLHPGEDVDFVLRLREAGARLYYHPGIAVERSRRSHLGSFLWQYFRYGLARGALFFHRPGAQLLFLLPLLLWLWLPLGGWVMKFYGLVCLLAALEVGARLARWSAVLAALPVVPAMHLSYGLGLGLGLIYKRLGFSLSRPRPAEQLRVTRHSG